ncbi:MAG: enoyl-CoA hydratase/isomerase family protein [Candidatus Krumholzibacteria bacterium]|nr:enoyl-CoA hydratase/isomerase family protein [Candidatus Krumholzibacteria bacterium]MDP7021727.1 enoyl-CoA hydratase/isomerase family protein [Candidatus Krumholzibacteria bacterium]
MSPELLRDFHKALDSLDGSTILLLSSEGKHFSTGYPIDRIPESIFHSSEEERRHDPFESLMQRLSDWPAPIVASLQGDAWGRVLELLSCADLRIAAEGIRLAIPSVRLGLVYSHTGMRRMGSALTRELFLTGETIDARRAMASGFLNRVCPEDQLEEETHEVLKSISKGTRAAFCGSRRLLNLLDEEETLSKDSLEEIARIRHEAFSSEESRKARAGHSSRKEG